MGNDSVCSNCKNTQVSNNKICNVCQFPLEDSKEKRRNYRDLTFDIKESLSNLKKQKLAISFLTVYFLFGSFLVWILDMNSVMFIIYILSGIVYLTTLLFVNFRKIKTQYFLSVFYLFHTFIEIVFNHLPRYNSYTIETGWFGIIPILFSSIPIIFIIIRISFLFLFFIGIKSVLHLNKNDKLSNYIISKNN